LGSLKCICLKMLARLSRCMYHPFFWSVILEFIAT
jgi:hypothetical protein